MRSTLLAAPLRPPRLRSAAAVLVDAAAAPDWLRFRPMADPSQRDIDALVGPATPHFAFPLRARVRELIEDLPAGHPVRAYGEEKMRLLEDLGHASSRAESGPKEPRTRIGWEEMPSSAPAYEPLPKRS
jgi:hypothetical protein